MVGREVIILKTNLMKLVLCCGLLILGSIIVSGTVNATTVNNSQINISSPGNVTGLSATYNNTTGSKPVASSQFNNSSTYPGSYDLRSIGKVTSIKNQGSAGDCWAFSTMGSLESNLLPAENDDFSENNMKNILSSNSPSGFDLSDGGDYNMALAYLRR